MARARKYDEDAREAGMILSADDRGDLRSLRDTPYMDQWRRGQAVRSTDTGQAYYSSVLRVEAEVLAKGAPYITPTDAQAMAAGWYATMAPATVNLTLAALGALWDSMAQDGLYRGPNPWRDHIRRRRPQTRVAARLLSPGEVERLVLAADPGIPRTFIRFLYATAARVSEAVQLRWENCRVEDGVAFCTLFGKGRKERTVRIRPFVWAEMCALPTREAGPRYRVFDVSRTGAWRIVRRAAEVAGFGDRGVSPHWLRHCHASHALNAGADIVRVQKMLGHARLDTTRIYAKLRPGPLSEDYLEDY